MRTGFWLVALGAVAMGCDTGMRALPEDAADVDGSAGEGVDFTSPPAAPAPAPARGDLSTGSAPEDAAARLTSATAKSFESFQIGPAASTGSTQVAAPSMIIRTGHATVEVDSLEPAVAAVQALALAVGGYVANVSMQTGRTQLRQATLEVKVPADRFDAAIEGLRPMGRLESMNVAVEDVGEEFTDVTARMSNARRLEERLLSLLANRTGRLEDILAAERELARVRQEIERYEGRLRYLRSRIALSTLHVAVHEPSPIIARAARNPIVEAFRGAWRNFVGFVAGMIELMGILVPLGAIVVLFVAVWLRWGHRLFRRAGAGSAAAKETVVPG